MLVQARQRGVSDAQLLCDYEPRLTQSDWDAAWNYYENNREEIDQAIRDNEDDRRPMHARAERWF
jgi:uncharacterized protein (DUF433 family)